MINKVFLIISIDCDNQYYYTDKLYKMDFGKLSLTKLSNAES